MAWNAAETVQDSIFVKYLEQKCKEKSLYIASGFNERDGETLFNSAVLVGPRGYIGKYRKLHLFLNERDFFQPGNVGLPVFDIGKAKLGLLVCFDWAFPEVWRILALKGADIICHPSNLVLPGFAQRVVPVHALTNRVYVATCNRVGTERGLKFTGLSIIADPFGNVPVQASQEGEVVISTAADVNNSRDKRITPRNHLFEDRRTAEYELLIR
jgi:predicted amidohydrolase